MKDLQMNLVMHYLDTWAMYWIARAQSDRVNNSICGSNIMDFGIYNFAGIKYIKDYAQTLQSIIKQDWPMGYPMNSGYLEFPLYIRGVFPLLRNNGLTNRISRADKADLHSKINEMTTYINHQINQYGLPQHLPFSKEKSR